jgi:hypothetical protein
MSKELEDTLRGMNNLKESPMIVRMPSHFYEL